MDELAAIFGEMGFTWAEGPDIEDDWHNFTALNIPPDHPARQMQDTFYLPPRADGTPMVLRTHTSPVQIAHHADKGVQKMLADGGSLRIIVPGRTFRIDNDATHTPMFHQVEGLVIDRDDAHGPPQGLPGRFLPRLLRGRRPAAALPPVLLPLHRAVGRGRYRLLVEGRRAARSAPAIRWLEILGCGMVHPNVLANCGLDPAEYQGFAFGMGIERIAMLKYGIPDLRTFFDADLRWLRHYGFRPLEWPSLTGGLAR